MTGLRVVRPGLFDTVQDRGRLRHRSYGVPVGGCFDQASASLANALVANTDDDAVVEVTLTGGTYEAEGPLALALAGAPIRVRIEPARGATRRLSVPTSFALALGDRLNLGGMERGARSYLAVRGGWQTSSILGSRSVETPLRQGDVLPCREGVTLVRRPAAAEELRLRPTESSGVSILRFVDGPDASSASRRLLDVSVPFSVDARSSRMGVRLHPDGESPPVPIDPNRLSTPVAPGAIQLAGGRPLILGTACGTMGGYPHIGHVISADLDELGQLRPGQRVRFQQFALADARRADAERLAELRKIVLRISTAATDGLR